MTTWIDTAERVPCEVTLSFPQLALAGLKGTVALLQEGGAFDILAVSMRAFDDLRTRSRTFTFMARRRLIVLEDIDLRIQGADDDEEA